MPVAAGAVCDEARLDGSAELEQRTFPVVVLGTSSWAMKTMRRGILKLDSRSRSAVWTAPRCGARRRRDHRRGDHLAELGIGQTRRRRQLDLGQGVQRRLDLEPRHVGRVRLDHVAGAADEVDVAVGVDAHEVPGRVEAVGREHRRAGHLVEAGHQRAAAQVQLTRPRRAAPPRRSPDRRPDVRSRSRPDRPRPPCRRACAG